MRNIFICVLLIVFTASTAICQQPGNVKAGLLIGLRLDKGSDTTYRTLWIAPDESDNKIKLTKQFQNIVVPYGSGFWEIEPHTVRQMEKNECDGNFDFIVEYLVAHPVNQPVSMEEQVRKYIKKCSIEEYGTDFHENSLISFVGNKYISLEQHACIDSDASWKPRRDEVCVREIKYLNRDFSGSRALFFNNHNLSLETVFGKKAMAEVDKYRNMAITEAEEFLYGPDPHIENNTNALGWAINRKNGKWISQIAKEAYFYNNDTMHISYKLFDLPFKLPSSIVTVNRFDPKPYYELKHYLTQIKDGVFAPDGEVMAVITDKKLLIYTISNQNFPDLALSINLNGEERIVMAEWAVGANVGKWQRMLSGFN